MKKAAALLLSILILVSLTGCSESSDVFLSMTGATIGALKGSASETIAEQRGTVRAYDTPEEVAAALKSGTVDYVLSSAELASAITGSQRGIKKLKTPFMGGALCIAIAKENPDLTEDVNAAIAALNEDGVFANIKKFYISGSGTRYEHAEREDGSAALTLATPKKFYPYAYIDEDGEWAGIDIDVAYAICDRLGVGLNVEDTPYDELVDAVYHGGAQIAMGAITSSADILEKVDLTDSYLNGEQIMIVRK